MHFRFLLHELASRSRSGRRPSHFRIQLDAKLHMKPQAVSLPFVIAILLKVVLAKADFPTSLSGKAVLLRVFCQQQKNSMKLTPQPVCRVITLSAASPPCLVCSCLIIYTPEDYRGCVAAEHPCGMLSLFRHGFPHPTHWRLGCKIPWRRAGFLSLTLCQSMSPSEFFFDLQMSSKYQPSGLKRHH